MKKVVTQSVKTFGPLVPTFEYNNSQHSSIFGAVICAADIIGCILFLAVLDHQHADQ